MPTTGAAYNIIDGNAPAITACALAEHEAASGRRGNSAAATAAAAFMNDLSLAGEERVRAIRDRSWDRSRKRGPGALACYCNSQRQPCLFRPGLAQARCESLRRR